MSTFQFLKEQSKGGTEGAFSIKFMYLRQPLKHISEHRPQSLCLLLQLLLQDYVQRGLAQGHGQVAAPESVEVGEGERFGDLREGGGEGGREGGLVG